MLKYLLAASFWTLLITVACLVSNDSFTDVDGLDIPYKDKYVHFLFYLVFTMLWHSYFEAKRAWVPTKTRLIVFLLAVAYGIVIEICQGLFTLERSADILDVLANTAGSATGILILWLWEKNKKIDTIPPL